MRSAANFPQQFSKSITHFFEGRRKKEEGRRKREEGRRKSWLLTPVISASIHARELH
ncbi:MAG: hypothetical protein MUE44_20300 [Oscillatoriaceae cyanobacterium Prado104]|nr:hypothetical protein [Oscillatoriaceae cyanobacterium Prado104]